MTAAKFTSIMERRINEDNSVTKYDDYCEPLYWFIKLYTKKTSIKMKDIASKLNCSPGALTKKLNIHDAQHRSISSDDIENLCSFLVFSMSSIIFLYENREVVEKKLSKADFSVLTDLFNVNSEKFLDFSSFSVNSHHQISSISSKTMEEVTGKKDFETCDLHNLLGKWFFYFPSSDSAIIEDREKELQKTGSPIIDNREVKELYDLYTPDHIYSGTFTISYKNHQYFSVMKYMTNPHDLTVLCYEGMVSNPVNPHTAFTALSNATGDDIIYMIIDMLSVEKKCKCIMAEVISLSRHKVEERHRPCSLRMILSRKPIAFDSLAYKVMLSNLMMNDSVIRIDDSGYGELKKYQDKYESAALDEFLNKYPSIGDMDGGSNYIEVHNCAFINESLIKSFNVGNIDQNDKLYLEALLRYHSIASWYSKTKSSKVNTIMKRFIDYTK